MNITCEVIRDILPLYTEQMTSADTNLLVEAHLASCDACRKRAYAMKPPVETEMPDGGELVNLGRQLRYRRRMTGLLAFLVTASVLVGIFAFFSGPVYLTAEEAKVTVEKVDRASFVYQTGEDGEILGPVDANGDPVEVSQSLCVSFGGKASHVSENESIDPDTGERVMTYTAACRRWEILLGREETSGMFRMLLDSDVSRVYYAALDGTEDVLLWGTEFSGGVQTLPRLVLGYYLLISAVLGGVLLLTAALARKSGVWRVLAAFGCFFASFAFSSLIVGGGKWPVFDASDVPTLLSLIVVLACLITASICCGWKVWKLHRQDMAV